MFTSEEVTCQRVAQSFDLEFSLYFLLSLFPSMSERSQWQRRC